MSDESVAGRGASLFSRSMSCGNEGDERAILPIPIAVFDLVSLLTFFSLVRVPGYLPSDRLVSRVTLHTRVLQGGNELCRIEGFDRRKAVSELKVSIAAEAGLVPALTRLINPESHVELQDHQTLEDAGMPSEHALAEGVIQLYAQKLKKVVVADELQIAPGEVTDSKLASLCDSIKDDPPDILVLCGCCRVTNISCLVQLSTISHLDISCCDLGAQGGFQPICSAFAVPAVLPYMPYAYTIFQPSPGPCRNSKPCKTSTSGAISCSTRTWSSSSRASRS